MKTKNYNMYALYVDEKHSNLIDDFVSQIDQNGRDEIEQTKREGNFDVKISQLFIKSVLRTDQILNKEKAVTDLVSFLENSLDLLIQIYSHCESTVAIGQFTSDIKLYGRKTGDVQGTPFNNDFDCELKYILNEIFDKKDIESSCKKKLVRSMVKNIREKFKELAQKSHLKPVKDN
jgi:hypothetical protein